jgi:N-acetylmuramoyl-L-alanine amidase
MKTESRILTRIALAACVACVIVSSVEARTVKQKKQAARTQFETAERLREALNGRPEAQRTRRDYTKVLDAYRKVYYTAPTSNKADAAVLAVAELLDEQGRVLNDPKSYKDAIGQLVFLRREYPGSKYRVEALFTIGEIFRDDLNDPVEAKATFEDYLKHYPNSRLAPQAKLALAEIAGAENAASARKKSARPKTTAHTAKTKAAWASITPAPAPPEEKAAPEKASKPVRDRDTGGDDRVVAATPETEPASAQPAQDVSLNQVPHRVARLTSVRHWSTPDYTRVAIDLEQEVQYQVGRVPHPDRIFFDLVGTRLAPDLVGKSFDVEAGFLHRIRVAQYKANTARVVLDVDDVAEYSAFLLPNPYRLIIDIHGKLPARQVAAVKPDVTAPAAQLATVKDKKAESAASDVTVTQLKPATGAKPAEATAGLSRADKPKPPAVAAQEPRSAPQAPTQSAVSRLAPESAAATQSAKDSSERAATAKDRGPAAEKAVEIAKAEPPKIAVDDTVMDEPTKTTSKPTTGPTFQAIAPQESSRNRKKTTESASKASGATSHVAAPTAAGNRSLIRALGLKIGKIVVDAGHGGHDTGTVGPNGLMEKDLVLDVALKLGKLLETKLGAEVVYTRDDDTFIPLETRTAIANKEQADMFISIHANSSSDTSARGVETYYLNFTTSRDALEVAARENAVSEKSIHELQDLVKKIALKEKIEESREFAADVQRSLYVGLNSRNPGVRNRGVKKAPFVVLIGANMPSILAEISFVSNPGDERKLKTSEYRQRIAESLYKGINKYVSGLSGVKVASQLHEDEIAKGASAVAAK